MEKTDTIILSPEELAAYMAESTISVTSTYEHSPVVLMVDDTIIGTLGNFSASIGKAKSKKTFNVSAIVASALNNSTVLHYRSTFPENKRKILYIDTEQGRYHCQQVLKRILRLADLPEYKNPDNLIMLALRKFSPKLRLAIVEQAIGIIPDLGLVIIDGIRDFLYDINSSSESTDIISKFMQWTDDRQIHIHTVLHQNKNDEHARGHIGTELNNKAETIMQVEVDKEDKAVSVVEAVHIRDREFEPFAFRINEEAMPEPVESYLPKEKVIFDLKKNEDARGSFTELLKTESCGQFSVNVSKPGITKGQHWHNTKWEFFIVVSGHGLIQERRVGSGEVLEFEVTGDKPQAIHMLPGYTHNIINLSETENLVTLMWANEQFDPAHPDTFFEKV